MLRKLIAFAVTSGLAVKLYQSYISKRADSKAEAAPARAPTRRRRAGTQADQG